MARQNPADDSCVGVLFRLVAVTAFVAAAVALAGWLS